ncbi:unnamed protein product (macronuclear) [Paramecium tetraurelia]|uniref:Thioredoxin domain-containing protein n=1 Tax=Paramecium tetraurelia TaxID=5888 RepID=A0DI01_PARTE|nr:uncharacterized protein GSPATT00017039001 [Paramecium tetraurelia]CAK82668.1 unnamed protein product [Paramecium tetraurelia]|eukprot:XP_001450065.1 hypothetical protein (macronuclear) [Paramecium tetraurelia strain d4-2]
MKYFFLLALVLVVLSREQIEEVDGVLQLTRKNFQQAVDENSRLLVKFYIDTCGYCKKMKPVFIQLAGLLKEYGFVLGEVNVHENKALSAKNNIKSYPTLKLFKNGVVQDFPNSSDSVELLFEFALQNAYDQITKLNTQDEIDLFLKRTNFAVLKYVNNNDDLQELVNENLGIKFGIVENPELQQAHPSKYTLYHKELPEPLNYNGEINGLLEWILKNGYPEVITLTEEEFVKAEREKISLIAVADVKNSQIHEHFKTLTKQYKNQIRFVLIDPNSKLPNKRFQYLIKKKAVAKNAIYFYNYETNKTNTIELVGDSLETLKKLIGTVIIESSIQQEAKPVDSGAFFQGDGQVHVLTTANFKHQVYDNPNHVFVKIYAPWCGHCKKLAPAYEELAQQLNRKDIVIAEVDFTADRIEGIEIEGYPTLLFFKTEGGQKKKIEFSGERTAEGMKNFILKSLDSDSKSEPESQLTEESQDVQEIDRVDIPNEGQVIQLTRENFEHFVLRSKQDVFVKFYAPWCGHCKAMAADYVKLAEEYKDSKNVLIAEIDATAYKIPIVEVKGFPTLVLFKKGNVRVKQVKFSGKRSAQGMKTFIEENGSFAQKKDL